MRGLLAACLVISCLSIVNGVWLARDPSWVVDSSGTPWVDNGVTYNATKAFDGDTETYWNPLTDQNNNNWYIVLDLTAHQALNRIAINNYGDTIHDISAFTLQKSQVGSPYNWEDVVSVTDVQGGTDDRQEFGGFQGTARYWRFVVTRTHSGYQPYLRELNLYGNSSVPKKWREDLRCGQGYPAEDGSPAECDPHGLYPCCSPENWCGNIAAHCDCPTCVDYRDTQSVINSIALRRRVGFWPMNAEHLANDISGGGNNGVAVGATLTEGPNDVPQSAYSFVGNDQSYIEIPNNGNLDVKRSFTILLFAYYIGGHSMLDYRGPGPGTFFWIFPSGSQLYVDISRYWLQSSGQWLQGQWAFLGVTYDYTTGQVQLWKDGVNIGSTNFGQLEHSTANPIRVGSSRVDPQPFNGRMLCLQIYNYALSEEEIQDTQEACDAIRCPLGYFRCGLEQTACILAWKRCDGQTDCSDGSDEEGCECLRIPGNFTLRDRLAMLPNPLGQATFEDVQNSSVAELLDSSHPEMVHPEFREFASTIIFPRCNVSDCPSSGNADNTTSCTGTQLLPCRSWCEEVLNTADDGIKKLLPGCDLFPSTQHDCWNPEPKTTYNGLNYEVCYHGSGMNYRGTGSTTTSGADCVEWSAAQSGFYPWGNLDKNYCRNPTGLSRPFCMTEDGGQEECDLIPCNTDLGCLDMGPPNYGNRSPGKKFYYLGERVAFTCDEGYKLPSGYPREVRCIGGGTWQHDKPTCSVNMKSRLKKELLDVNSADLAPEDNIVISFIGFVEQIVDLDEKKEQLVASVVMKLTWQDSRLKWDPKYYNGTDAFSTLSDRIWTPSMTLKRNADPLYRSLEKRVPIGISSNGTVTWTVETLTTTVCDADPFYFPADTMECEICFSATSEIDQTIQCGDGSSTEDETNSPCDVSPSKKEEGEWYRKDRVFARDDKEACFVVHLERIPMFHIATTVGPCFILVVLMIITFIMPIDRGDRISFGVTIQLSMVVSLVFVTEVLPVKGALPFFAMLIVVCMGLMGLFLFFTMGIIKLHDKEGSLPPDAKTFFLRYMAKMLLLGDLTKNKRQSDDGETSDIVMELTNVAFDAEDAKAASGETPSGETPADVSGTSNHSFALPATTEPTVRKRSTFQGSPSPSVRSADVSKATAQPAAALEASGSASLLMLISSVKELKTELSKAVNNQTREIKSEMGKLSKAVNNQTEDLAEVMKKEKDPEVSDYTLLAKVLDRLCLVLYVISIIVAVPTTMYLGK